MSCNDHIPTTVISRCKIFFSVFFFPTLIQRLHRLRFIYLKWGFNDNRDSKKKKTVLFSVLWALKLPMAIRINLFESFSWSVPSSFVFIVFFRNLLSMFQVVHFLFRPIKWLVTFVWILVKFMTQLFFTKPPQSHRHHQWLDKKRGKPCGTVATTCYFSPLLLAKLATQNEAVTFSSIANIFNYLANRNLLLQCVKKKKKESKDCPMVRELPT